MHAPSEDEIAAIVLAYRTLQRMQTEPPPVSRWRLAARRLASTEQQRDGWRTVRRLR